MKINFYQPSHPTLKKYIEGYYFISDDGSDEPVRYLTFPDNYFILSACQNAEIIHNKNHVEIRQSSTENMLIDFVLRSSAPVDICYQQAINEVTIYFKPLGIYHFFEAEDINVLKTQIPLSDFKEVMNSILKESDRKIQIENLEKHWLSKFKLKNLKLINEIVRDFDSELKIEEIAKKNNITRQYVNKVSNRYLGKPASEYRKIQRFRNTLLHNKNTKNLTELSYENLFFDQSHFIRDFKELTQTLPSFFFENVDTKQNNVWLFI